LREAGAFGLEALTEPKKEPKRPRNTAVVWGTMLGRRLLWGVLVLIAIATVTFFLTHYVPSDPAVYLAGPSATTSTIEHVRKQFGLDRPLVVQYAKYMESLVRGDLGISLFTKRSVSSDIARSIPITLGLIVPAFAVYVILALVLGFVAAYGRLRARGVLIRLVTMTVSAAPVYWVALVLQFFLFYKVHLFPSGGQSSLAEAAPPTITRVVWLDSLLTLHLSAFVDALWHLVLPLTVVVLGLLAVGTRLMTAAVSEELEKNYVRTARGKGLSESKIRLKHILRATINSFVTVTGVQFGYLITYTILVEVVFTWPGLGYYLDQSIQINDYAPLIGVTLVAALAFVLISIVSDIIYHLVDPRIDLT